MNRVRYGEGRREAQRARRMNENKQPQGMGCGRTFWKALEKHSELYGGHLAKMPTLERRNSKTPPPVDRQVFK